MKRKIRFLIVALLGCLVQIWGDLSYLIPGQKDTPDELAVEMMGRWAKGAFGKAAYLGKEGDSSILFKDQAAVRVGKGDFSLLMWLCPDTLKTKDETIYRRILLKINKENVFWVLDVFEDGRLMFSMRDDGGHYASTKSESVLKVGKWQHVAVVVDREGKTTSYYVNGQAVGIRNHNPELTGNLDVPNAPLIVSTWAGRKFEGLFGGFRLVNRKMDEDEIKKEYKMAEGNYMDTKRELSEREVKMFSPALPKGIVQTMWNMAALSIVPKTYPVLTEPFNEMINDDVKPIMYDGVPYKGKATRVFAWIGFPKGADAEHPVPGMVLVHGGGGTAFRTWVKTWNDRGYAAIAMDTCGHLPLPLDTDGKPWPKHEWSGPAGWGDFGSVNEPVNDQWTYHAVAAVVLGHSLLRSFKEVDAEKTGVTGISWGGYLTNIVSGVDDRFKFAAPVYGCGFLGEGSGWQGMFQGMGDNGMKWLRLWDPAEYVCFAKMPMLFCNGTNDIFYRTPVWHKTTLLPRGEVFRSYKIRMPHGHGAAGDPPEIKAFADWILKGGEPLPKLLAFTAMGRQVMVKIAGGGPLLDGRLAFTKDDGEWPERNWEVSDADYDEATGTLKAVVPSNAKAAYLFATDKRGMTCTSEVVFY